MDRTRLGRRGEELAARYLEGKGWTILSRNYRSGPRELDLVARKGSVLAFVEVKTRRSSDFGDALEGITWKKRKEVEACARAWIDEHPWPSRFLRRFDAVAVRLADDGSGTIEHLEDAWRVGD